MKSRRNPSGFFVKKNVHYIKYNNKFTNIFFSNFVFPNIAIVRNEPW
jgi:hypothetical protein